MNRHQKAALAVAAAAALSFSLTSTAYAAAEEKPSYASSTIVVSDVRTGEIVYQQTDQIPVDEGTTTATIETRVPSPHVPVNPGVVAPRSSVGGNYDNGSIKSSITITYSLNSRGDQIRTEKVTGRWTPDPGFALQGRKVEIYSGGGSPSIIKKAPTANTYSYNTGWGFQTKPPQNSLTSPRVLAEVKFKLSGTGSAWLKLTHWVDLSGV